MAAEQGPMSGFRDMLADQMIPRQAMTSTIQEVYEGYGFTPLKTPALERLSTMTGKYGEEADKLMYKFQDNGGRDVAMRYDQTVPLARVVAQHSGRLVMPYKRYAVGEVWRGESPQHGRYREFTQFDADTVGSTSAVADTEIVAMMSDAMTALGADSLIRVNNRRILDGLAKQVGAETEKESVGVISTIDKVEKIGQRAVIGAIAEDYGDRGGELVEKYLSVEGSSQEKLQQLTNLLTGSDAVDEGVQNLTQVFDMLDEAGYTSDKIVFDQTIARGLDYYTGIIYETTLKTVESIGSVCSGGRFDNLIEAMGGPSLPAVGTSIGVDRLYDGLKQLGVLRIANTTTEVLVTNFENTSAPTYMKIATLLRNAGVPSEVYYDAARMKKQLRHADKVGIPYVILAGPDELSRGSVVIKTLSSGEQVEVALDEIPETIASLKGKDTTQNFLPPR
jgi:histidyl-tRNA synthetase